MIEKLVKIKERADEIQNLLSTPEVIADNKKCIDLSKELKNIMPVAELYDKVKTCEDSMADAKEMLKEEKDPEMVAYLEDEIKSAKENLAKYDDELKILLLPKDENDDKNVIIEIRAGAGGEEAALFGAEIMRMYLKFAEKQRWKVEIMELNDTELGGVKEATFMVKGTGAYAKFKYESGVHRVQRVPDTETQGRVHTSTITVAVLPEVEDVDFEIDDKDLRIDTCRASGAGGQHINKTDSAIRITHIPTNTVVFCQDQRSQLQNKERAMQILKSKLYDMYKQEADEEYAKNRRLQVGTGDRSERIRTYNYPQGRVTDHRIGMTIYTLNLFLEGEIGEMIQALEIADQKAKLEGEKE